MAAGHNSLASPFDGLARIPVPRVASDAPVTSEERLILILSRDAEAAARDRSAKSYSRLLTSLSLTAAVILSFDLLSVLHAIG